MSNCPSVIEPGQIGYFYNSTLSELIDDSVNIADVANVVPHYEVVEATQESINYEISDISISEEYGCAKIVGRVTNTTNKDDSGIYVNVICYNKEGNVIGITGTNVYDVKARETKSFDLYTMYMAGDAKYTDIADYKVIAQADYYQW